MRVLITLLGIGAILYALLTLALWRFQSRLIYYPSEPTRLIEATPAEVGLRFEDVVFQTEDDVTLHGWFVPADGPATVLYFHGNAGNISHRLDTLRRFHDLGMSVFMIDYRGYGRSDGTPGENGTYRDALAAWHYLTRERGLPPERIVVLGRSLGGAIAAQLATVVEPAGVVLDSTFTSIPDMARHAFPWLPASLAHIRYDTLGRMGSIRAPVLLMHSRDDEMIPFAHGERLRDAAPAGTRLIALRGRHNETTLASGRLYTDALRDFIVTAVASRVP